MGTRCTQIATFSVTQMNILNDKQNIHVFMYHLGEYMDGIFDNLPLTEEDSGVSLCESAWYLTLPLAQIITLILTITVIGMNSSPKTSTSSIFLRHASSLMS